MKYDTVSCADLAEKLGSVREGVEVNIIPLSRKPVRKTLAIAPKSVTFSIESCTNGVTVLFGGCFVAAEDQSYLDKSYQTHN